MTRTSYEVNEDARKFRSPSTFANMRLPHNSSLHNR